MNFTHDDLAALHPCNEALQWAATQPDAATAWDNCEQSDWLLWLLERIQRLDKEQSVKLAVAFAKEALPKWVVSYPDDDRPAQAIAYAEVWLATPTSAAMSAAESAARSAASAARNAAWSAAMSAAESAAESAAKKRQAKIIRQIIPNPFL